MSAYYPLAVGNVWHYAMKDGNTYTNSITGGDGAVFTAQNSTTPTEVKVQKDGGSYLTNSHDPAKMQVFLKEEPTVGDSWEIKFQANGLDSVLVMTIKEVGGSQVVEGKTFENVALVEAESKMVMNGNLMSLNYFTQYYYAKGVGLILTTSSMGDSHALTSYSLN